MARRFHLADEWSDLCMRFRLAVSAVENAGTMVLYSGTNEQTLQILRDSEHALEELELEIDQFRNDHFASAGAGALARRRH